MTAGEASGGAGAASAGGGSGGGLLSRVFGGGGDGEAAAAGAQFNTGDPAAAVYERATDLEAAQGNGIQVTGSCFTGRACGAVHPVTNTDRRGRRFILETSAARSQEFHQAWLAV